MAKKKKKRVWKIKNILILLGIVLGLTALIYYALIMPIKNIYIKGNSILSDNEIIELSSLANYPSFLLTKSTEIKSKLKQNPYIEQVKVKKKLESCATARNLAPFCPISSFTGCFSPFTAPFFT